MMTKLRESTAIIMWIVILAFVGLIVVEWGADYSGTSRSRSDAVGVINGQEVSLKLFQQALRNAARQRGREDRGDDGALVREVWQAIVSETVVNQELDRLGIQITDEELATYTREAPPQAVQDIEVFQTDGEFDPQLYQQFLHDQGTFADAKNREFIMQIERMWENQLLNHRLQTLLMETVRVSAPEVRRHYVDRNEKVKVEYVFSPSASASDGEIELEEAEIEAEYSANADDYRHGRQVKIRYALFPRVPSAADSAEIKEQARSLREDIVAGADFGELARAMSEDEGSASSGGDLGSFGRGRMVAPFEEAVFALEAGEVSQPVLTQFGWHLIKLEERLEENGEEKVRARHILLKFTQSQATENSLHQVASDFRELAGDRGIDAAAEIEGIEVRDPGFVPPGSVIPGLGLGTGWVVNLFFDSEVGTVSRVGSVEGAFWVAQLVEAREEGVAPLEEVRSRVERSLQGRKRAEAAGEVLREIRGAVLGGGDLAAAVAANGMELSETEPFARADFVPGVGRDTEFTRAAFSIQPGDLSDVVSARNGAYLLRVIEKIPIDEEAFLDAREALLEELLKERRNEALQVWLSQFYAAAEIEDNRHLFYTF